MSHSNEFMPLPRPEHYSTEEAKTRADAFYQAIKQRRSVRDFSEQNFDRSIIESCILAAGSAPNGANLQPWHFAVVENPEVKRQIRIAAEKEEQKFYNGRASEEWLDVLAPLGTDESKPFLETAPYLIVIFSKAYDVREDGTKAKNYYTAESVGIATGFLIAALHHAGIATLTHTPSPMKFLNEILGRPTNERPFLVLVTGYPSEDAQVPVITKKPLQEIASFH